MGCVCGDREKCGREGREIRPKLPPWGEKRATMAAVIGEIHTTDRGECQVEVNTSSVWWKCPHAGCTRKHRTIYVEDGTDARKKKKYAQKYSHMREFKDGRDAKKRLHKTGIYFKCDVEGCTLPNHTVEQKDERRYQKKYQHKHIHEEIESCKPQTKSSPESKTCVVADNDMDGRDKKAGVVALPGKRNGGGAKNGVRAKSRRIGHAKVRPVMQTSRLSGHMDLPGHDKGMGECQEGGVTEPSKLRENKLQNEMLERARLDKVVKMIPDNGSKVLLNKVLDVLSDTAPKTFSEVRDAVAGTACASEIQRLMGGLVDEGHVFDFEGEDGKIMFLRT